MVDAAWDDCGFVSGTLLVCANVVKACVVEGFVAVVCVACGLVSCALLVSGCVVDVDLVWPCVIFWAVEVSTAVKVRKHNGTRRNIHTAGVLSITDTKATPFTMETSPYSANEYSKLVFRRTCCRRTSSLKSLRTYQPML